MTSIDKNKRVTNNTGVFKMANYLETDPGLRFCMIDNLEFSCF